MKQAMSKVEKGILRRAASIRQEDLRAQRALSRAREAHSKAIARLREAEGRARDAKNMADYLRDLERLAGA